MRRVDTSIDYGDVHEEGRAFDRAPDGAIVEWVGAEDLPMLTPGPTVGSAVEIESDGQEPQVLLGTPDQWPNIDRFQPVDRLPDIAGEYVLIFQARYEEGVAREVKRVQLVDPGAVLQLLHCTKAEAWTPRRPRHSSTAAAWKGSSRRVGTWSPITRCAVGAAHAVHSRGFPHSRSHLQRRWSSSLRWTAPPAMPSRATR